MYATAATSASRSLLLSGALAGALLGAEPRELYRPRHPERQVVYQVFEQHFEAYRYAHEERFEPRDGPLRAVVPASVEAYLACGRPEGGFARLKCEACGGEHLLAFSCRTRSLCGSCQAKRAALLGEKLVTHILATVPHRHLVATIPRVLRGLFRRDRRLLGLLSRCLYDAVHRLLQALFDRRDVRPGCVASLQTFGSFAANWNPHVHAIFSAGCFTPDGDFLEVPSFDTDAIERLFRALLLERLQRAQRLSPDFRARLLSWSPSGFSVFAQDTIPADDIDRLEHLARYIARPPVRIDDISLRPDGNIVVKTPPDPRTGQSNRLLDPLELIHALTTQIPDPKQHLLRYLGAYSNRSHAAPRPQPPPAPQNDNDDTSDDPPPYLKARKASWARLLLRIFEVDPLLCPCGGQLRILSVITEPQLVLKILRHLQSDDTHAFDPFEPKRSRAPPPLH